MFMVMAGVADMETFHYSMIQECNGGVGYA